MVRFASASECCDERIPGCLTLPSLCVEHSGTQVTVQVTARNLAGGESQPTATITAPVP